jgi:hypothetical protein
MRLSKRRQPPREIGAAVFPSLKREKSSEPGHKPGSGKKFKRNKKQRERHPGRGFPREKIMPAHY